MYWKLFGSYLEASDGLSQLSPSFAADSDLCNVDSACDSKDYSESC